MTITPQSILRFTVGLAVTAVILYLMWFFSAVVRYILVSAVLAIMGRPLVNKLSELSIRGRHLPRWCAATITLIVIWVVFATIFSLFIPLIFGKINEFASLDFSSVLASIEEPKAQAQAYIQHTFAMPETQFSLTDTLATTLKNLIDYDTINNAFLAGADWFLHSADFRNTLNLKVLYKYITYTDAGTRSRLPLQFTAAWTMKELFGLAGLTFTGFADFWWEEHTLLSDRYGDILPETSHCIFITEPQLWYNAGRHFGCDNLNVGGEVELSYDFGTVRGFRCRPCAGVKWVF